MDGMDLVASFAYTDLEEYLLSDGTSATFYGYELTPACQADRATLNSFTRPDLFGPVAAPFVVLPQATLQMTLPVSTVLTRQPPVMVISTRSVTRKI